jgi:5-methylcytosine-specific restriction endonuclease McrA
MAQPLHYRIYKALRDGQRAHWDPRTEAWTLRADGADVQLTDQRGNLTAAGKHYKGNYYRVVRKPAPRLLAWNSGTAIRGNADVATLKDGTVKVLRRWDGENYRPTAWGKDYYANHRAQFTVRLPVTRVVRKIQNGRFVVVPADHGDGLELNVTDEQITRFLGRDIADLAVVPANATPEKQRAWIREAIDAYVARLPDEGGLKILTDFEQSDCSYAIDATRQPAFDEEITHVKGDGPMAIELILNRPLRGMVIVPEDMYAKTGLMPIAYENNGQCVLTQLALCLTKRADMRRRNRYGRTDQETDGGRPYVPRWTLHQLADIVDEHFQRRYPLVEGHRPDPYFHGTWRDVGITAQLVLDICEHESTPCYVLHSDRLIQSFAPEVRRHNTQVVCFNVWSDHAFFYDGRTKDGGNAKSGIAQMRVVKPAAWPAKRLLVPTEDDERISYKDMRPYSDEEFIAGLNTKTTLYTQDIEAAIRCAEDNRVSFVRIWGNGCKLVGITTTEQKSKARVRLITFEHERLNDICNTFAERNECVLEYKGESMPLVVHRMLYTILVRRRRAVSQEDRDAIRQRQGDRCNACDRAMRANRGEVDHIKPLSEGGENDSDNLQILCTECHEYKTQAEELARGNAYHPLESQLSPTTHRLFHKAPKPMERSGAWGENQRATSYTPSTSWGAAPTRSRSTSTAYPPSRRSTSSRTPTRDDYSSTPTATSASRPTSNNPASETGSSHSAATASTASERSRTCSERTSSSSRTSSTASGPQGSCPAPSSETPSSSCEHTSRTRAPATRRGHNESPSADYSRG